MNTNQIVRFIHRLAVVTIVASFALVSTVSAQMETHNPYTVRGLQIRTNLIPDQATEAYSAMALPDAVGPTLFQEMVPCRFVSTLDPDQYPQQWGGQAFQVSESRVYRPIGYLAEGSWKNPCSELIPAEAVALAVRVASYQPAGNGSVFLAPAELPTLHQPALIYKQGYDTQDEAVVVLDDHSFVVSIAEQSTDLTIDIIGYFIPDANKGEKGDVGPRGPEGARGEKGDKGDPGVAGAQGEKGDKGDQGLAGVQGAKGDKGDKGDQGVAGAQGEKGDKGDQGVAGAQGAKGDKGDRGEAGAQGLKGDKGDRGEAGAQGAKGDKGDKGDRGLQGERGFQGAVGPQGPEGPQGPQGLQGIPGVSMTSGTSKFPPPGTITIYNSNIKSDSIILMIYTEVSNGNALGVASQKNGSFVATGSPNKPFQWVVFNAN